MNDKTKMIIKRSCAVALLLVCAFLIGKKCGTHVGGGSAKTEDGENKAIQTDTQKIISGTDTYDDDKNTGKKVADGGTTAELDISNMSSTVVYAALYNVLSNPDKYIGKKIKMSGNFSYYEDEINDYIYYSCVVMDQTACCSLGMEFITKDERVFPDDYPEEGEKITIEGVFETYFEDGKMYGRLKDSSLSIG